MNLTQNVENKSVIWTHDPCVRRQMFSSLDHKGLRSWIYKKRKVTNIFCAKKSHITVFRAWCHFFSDDNYFSKKIPSSEKKWPLIGVHITKMPLKLFLPSLVKFLHCEKSFLNGSKTMLMVKNCSKSSWFFQEEHSWIRWIHTLQSLS